MDYEKKYKEALERAKKGECLENIFPELKESEDDKMRAMVIKAVYAPEAQSCIKSWGVNPDDVIAWLEKHGDTYDYTRVDLSKFDDRIQEFSDMLEDKPKSYWDGFYEAMDWIRINGNPFKEKQGKQKSTKNIMNVWKDMRLEVYLQASGNRHEPNYSDDTTKMFSLNDIDEIIEKMSEQNPIISNNALREGITHFGITQYQIDNWLKKYVDVETQDEFQYWKPSKEQLEALDYAYNSCPDTERGNYYEGVLRTLIDELYKLQPKQGKPKPVDKAQPKFKVGDWITNSIETVQITGYDIDYGYQVDYKGKLQHRDTDIIEKEYHLWAIQDAKDGDVLVAEIDEELNDFIYIFKEYNKNLGFWSHCYLDAYTNKFHEGIYHNNLNVGVPATKEQRDMFFQKMHEAGYEWDFEVKELNKIEKKPACSKEEKQLLLKDLCGRLPYGFKYQVQYGDTSVRDIKKFILDGEYSLFDTWMVQEIKPYLRSISSMTEEEKKTLNNVLEYQYCSDDSCMCESTDWLNSHHFDYRGLIEKGLALEAPFGMYQ